MRVLGPNCLGMINTDPAVRMNATLAPVVPPPGRIGFFCQSGALGIAILADAASRGLGLSTFVSAGNRADVSGNDLLQYWHGDDRTEVVLLYLESFGNPRKFARLARVLARTKPVIAVKSGRHSRVTPGLAASSAPLSDAAVATLFEQSGVIRTPGLTTAFDVAQLLSTQPVPPRRPGRHRRQFQRAGRAGGGFLPGRRADRWPPDAPVDLGVNVSAEELAGAVRAAVEPRRPRRAGGGLGTAGGDPGAEHAIALRDAVAGAPIPVVTTFLAVDGLMEHSGGAGRRRQGRAAGRCPPTGRWNGRCRRCPTPCGTATWLARPPGRDPGAGRHRPGGGTGGDGRHATARRSGAGAHRRRGGHPAVAATASRSRTSPWSAPPRRR